LTEVGLVVSDDPRNPEATKGNCIPIVALQGPGGLRVTLR